MPINKHIYHHTMPCITIVPGSELYGFGKNANHRMGFRHNAYVRECSPKTMQKNADPTLSPRRVPRRGHISDHDNFF